MLTHVASVRLRTDRGAQPLGAVPHGISSTLLDMNVETTGLRCLRRAQADLVVPEAHPQPAAEPTARSVARGGAWPPAAELGARLDAARRCVVRVGHATEPCLFSDDLDRLAVVCHGGRLVGRNRRRRQRRHRRRRALHGRRDDAEPRHRAERRARLSLEGAVPQAGIHARRGAAAPAAALHASPVDADGADGGVQSAPLRRSAALPLAVAELRPACRRTS